jgi:hypothetical protein
MTTVGICGVLAIPARAQFGLDTAVLYSILTQIQQEVAQARLIYQGVVTAKNEITQAANYVRHPQNWRTYLDTASRITGVSNGTDWAELQRINGMLKATREAMDQFSYTQLSAGDMARMNQLGIQMMDLQQRADALNASLESIGTYRSKVQSSGDWGCVSCSVGAHQQ